MDEGSTQDRWLKNALCLVFFAVRHKSRRRSEQPHAPRSATVAAVGTQCSTCSLFLCLTCFAMSSCCCIRLAASRFPFLPLTMSDPSHESSGDVAASHLDAQASHEEASQRGEPRERSPRQASPPRDQAASSQAPAPSSGGYGSSQPSSSYPPSGGNPEGVLCFQFRDTGQIKESKGGRKGMSCVESVCNSRPLFSRNPHRLFSSRLIFVQLFLSPSPSSLSRLVPLGSDLQVHPRSLSPARQRRPARGSQQRTLLPVSEARILQMAAQLQSQTYACRERMRMHQRRRGKQREQC